MGRKRIRTLQGWVCEEGHNTKTGGIVVKRKTLTNGDAVEYYSCRLCSREYDRKSWRRRKGGA